MTAKAFDQPRHGSGTDLFVWHACLDATPALERALEAALSDEERTRAVRFRFERDRRRFIVARSVLRSILGSLLCVKPSRVGFRYGDRGKPFLSEEFERQRLFFNVAHSQGHGMFAVAANAEVGVDIEVIRSVADAMAIAERFFSPRESAAIRALPAPLGQTAFFHCWTRKEAYIKGLGEGLSHPLDRFDVTVAPGQAAELFNTSGGQDGAGAWRLHDLSRLPTYASAVAVKGDPARLHVRSWDIASAKEVREERDLPTGTWSARPRDADRPLDEDHRQGN